MVGLRKRRLQRLRTFHDHDWPIDPSSNQSPPGWCGWPDQKQFAFVLTHDVETIEGYQQCPQVMALEKQRGVRSSFNFVPEGYSVSHAFRHQLVQEGFEVGVHGLKHDGKLYFSKSLFQKRAQRINDYLHEWNSVGFRSPLMHHNLDWLHDLHISYDASTFDTDPFEPQSDGVHTIYPFWVAEGSSGGGYVELPYTLPQDFTLFILMEEDGIDIWKKKVDWLAQQGGMVLLITHPDYMHFGSSLQGNEQYPARYYDELLEYITTRYAGQYWSALPNEVARYYKETKRSLRSVQV